MDRLVSMPFQQQGTPSLGQLESVNDKRTVELIVPTHVQAEDCFKDNKNERLEHKRPRNRRRRREQI